MLEIRNLHKAFGSLEVLKGIDVNLEKGKVLAIIGPSGSGKTTLLRCINLLEMPDQGTMKLSDRELNFQPGRKIASREVTELRKRTGMVFQSYNLFPHKNVMDNIMEGPVVVQKKDKAQAFKTAQGLLEKVGLGDRGHYYPHQLSGGQQQRVGIARAMAMEPDVLLFDEPTSALDPELVGEVLRVIKQLALEGRTMVIVTHEMKFAADVADHVILMDGGHIIEQGPPDQVINHPQSARAQQFMNRISGEDI
ncbi:amino acid ABC transporter ATP-binding protein [Paenibacillus bovis]|uniref:Ectoine/hydroxyectoine ABC transporter ATP-binding protein EhuA n=1 Tax=Paenibacillus bovis TaxID=1616788 RepID=A0A172ZMX2_9BACL|nr:amino acid ABC transporter ATP-binding protein [Paenibacillus bovis]ANF98909.1 ectoine/hydroxyectoine ABC transporter ATP-binding protein EhuA [Paenibacillus bovis]